MRLLAGLLGRAHFFPELAGDQDLFQKEDGGEEDAGIHPQRRKSANYLKCQFFGAASSNRSALIDN